MTISAPWCQDYGCANTDGIDVDSSSDVVIERNVIDCGDDHVTVISGAGEPGRAFGMPSRNVTVRDNILGTGMGLSIGSSISGGVEGVMYSELRRRWYEMYVSSRPKLRIALCSLQSEM
jgi:polygalacturonase